MNTEPTNLDDRAAAAARDLHERATHRAVPTFDPDRLPTPLAGGAAAGRPGRRLAAVAAAVVLLVGGAVVATQLAGGDDDGNSQVATTNDRARPYLAGWLPDGFAMAGVVTVDDGDVASEEWFTQLHVFGVAGEPVAGVLLGPRWENLDVESTTSVDVGGRQVRHLPAPVGNGVWSVVEVGDRTIVAMGAELGDEERDRLAAESTVEAGRLVVPDGATEGWDLLTVLPDASAAMPSTLYRVIASGQLDRSSYARTGGGQDLFEGGGAMVTITSMAVEGDALTGVEVLDPTVEDVEVRGSTGLVGHVIDDDPAGGVPDVRYVTWREGPGVVVSVAGIGIGQDELLRIVADIRPAEADEWADLEHETRLGRFADAIDYPDRRTIELGVGELADGATWRLVAREPGDDTEGEAEEVSTLVVDLTVVVDGESRDSNSTSWDAGTPFGPTQVTESGGRRVAGGLLGDGSESVTRIRVERRDGTATDGATLLEAEAYRGWAVELPADGLVLVALDSAGAEVGRLVLDSDEGCGEPADETGSTNETCGWGEDTPATTEPEG